MNADEGRQLQTIAADVREIKLAVMGDEKIGLPGLVHDVRNLKQWRASMDIRTAAIGGGASALVLVGKWLFSLMS